MLRNVLVGAAAGAVGTVALDATTYADMAARGRAPSSMVRTVVQKLAQRGGVTRLATSEPDDATKNRQDAIGALLGYATGVGVGLVYGAIRDLFDDAIPAPVAGLIAGAAAMALTDGTAVALGATDISQWDVASWLSDLVPHAVFGLATAYSYEALAAIERGNAAPRRPTSARWKRPSFSSSVAGPPAARPRAKPHAPA
jgi:hypothetical protein